MNSVPTVFPNSGANPLFTDWRPGDQKIFVADCSKLAAELNWKPRVSPEQGVNLLFDWVIEHREALEKLCNR